MFIVFPPYLGSLAENDEHIFWDGLKRRIMLVNPKNHRVIPLPNNRPLLYWGCCVLGFTALNINLKNTKKENNGI